MRRLIPTSRQRGEQVTAQLREDYQRLIELTELVLQQTRARPGIGRCPRRKGSALARTRGFTTWCCLSRGGAHNRGVYTSSNAGSNEAAAGVPALRDGSACSNDATRSHAASITGLMEWSAG